MLRRVVLSLAAASLLAAQAPLPVPRKAPDFTVISPNGGSRTISSLKGNVVALCFIFTTCPHCQQMSVEMNNLYKEYGNQGFIPVEVAWNEGAKDAVPQFVKQFDLYIPVGYSDRAAVLGYLGISMMDQRLVVPQIVWIDRKGMIRSQTPAVGDAAMLNEQYFRKMLAMLLPEPGAPAPRTTTKR
jgi:peroxiredoxin